MRLISAAAILALGAASALADITVEMTMVNDKGLGDAIGKVTISENQYGIVLTPALKGLPPGAHGFHLHQNPSCDPQEKDGKMTPALAAGGHFDPAETKRHGAPWADGHLGDLPVLVVDADGNTAQPVLSPRLKMADVAGRALMIHAGGDNYADEPAPLGGGGGRIACGVVK